MLEQIPSYFNINISFFVLLLVVILSGLFSYFQYKRTVPPVSKFLQITLSIIRGSAVACVLLLIFAPEITAIWQKSKSGQLIIAVDKSASMGLIENNRSRLERALELGDKVIDNAAGKAEIAIYGFDIDTAKVNNLDLDTTQSATNIDKSLQAILAKEKDATNLILITDGNFSIGNNPLYSSYLNQVRINTIGIGDTIDLPDIMITEVQNNTIVYQNQKTQIQVYIMSRGIESRRVNLSMKQGNRILQAKDIEIEGDGKTVIAEFEVVPDKVGLNQIDFSLQPIPGEAITQNNKYTISMEVLKGKIQVGLIASKPGYDTKFLNQLLNNQDDIDFNMSIRLKAGKYFPTIPADFIDNLDVVIFSNYPPAKTSDSRATQYMNRLDSKKIPALSLFSESISHSQIASIKKFFPLKTIVYSNQYIETQVTPSVAGNNVPVLSIFEDDEAKKRFWSICPPIQYPYSQITFSSPVKELLRIKKSNNEEIEHPVLLVHETRGRKGALLLGVGFWRWSFLLTEDAEYKNSWQQMIKNLIRWLDTGAVDKNVILSARKKDFQVGDNILLTTQVYDGSLKPVNDGLIRTYVSGPTVSFEIESEFREEGRYEGGFVPLAPGRYKIRSEAWRNNIKLGIDEIDLIITTVNREFLSTKQNLRFLQRLSEKSGGEYFNETEVDELIASLDLAPELIQESDTIELWNRWPFLLLILILLSLEWFIRKKKDLA
jgi:hypothetical protein